MPACGTAPTAVPGRTEVLKAGELQRMSTGTGILHSEFNASSTDPVHNHRNRIVPERRGVRPQGFEEKGISDAAKGGCPEAERPRRPPVDTEGDWRPPGLPY